MRKAGYQLDDDDKEALAEFQAKVNMTSRELERWLDTNESRAVYEGGGEAAVTGQEAARRTVSVLGKRRVDYTIGDIAHMRKVVGYINRHLARRPPEGAADPQWRHTLMNWGHDPAKTAGAETPA